MKTRISLCLTYIFLSFLSISAQINLISKGKTNYQIVIPTDALQVEKDAAKILQDAIDSITGIKLPVIEISKKPSNIPL